MKTINKIKKSKYEMAKRKEKWKSINTPLEKLMMIPLEAQSSVVEELVTKTCYNNLCKMLELPEIQISQDSIPISVDTIIPYVPPEEESVLPQYVRKSMDPNTKSSTLSTISESVTSSQFEYESISIPEAKFQSFINPSSNKTETDPSSDQNGTHQSDFVEVEKKIPYNQDLVLKHKSILKFLGLSEAEAATWRVKEAKDVSELSEMTLEEQGDFLTNKISVDFCEWMRKLGGDEKSFISEEILKELFQVGMDNPASRAICIKMREKRVLYYKLAEFLGVPEKSFHEVLSQHLNWDIKVEKNPTKLVAFSKGLPKDVRFKTPKNKTAETWLEWNKLSADQLSFADVYGTIKDLRSTKEYCKWLLSHPEHKKPQYLVDQGMFERISSGMQRMSTSDPSRRGRSTDTTASALGLGHFTFSSKDS